MLDEIRKRRAFRSLDHVEITDDLIDSLSMAAQLSPSCFNNQPWHFIFTYEKKQLTHLFQALSSGNDWAKQASMIIAVCAKEDDDCMIYDRKYYLFDLGLSSAFLMLQATKLGLVAHPIAGYSPKKVRKILSIPDEYMVITLIIVGKHSNTISNSLSEKQIQAERERPDRKPLETFIHHNTFAPKEAL